MHVERHTDPDTFLDAALPMAARGEASASFFIGAAHSLKRTPPRPSERVYLASFRSDEGLGVAIQRDNGPVLIGESDIAAARAFAEDLARDWTELQGVVGAAAGCEAFARRWRDLTGRKHRLRVRLRQHALTAVNAVPTAPGSPRLAEVGDLE
jgi:hypothetical protein